ncbi:hypothetical protein OUZ56_003357 [Daphnia magna]|uniref:GMP synthase n=1 Tax=Daphnia magna TaxID=35525 RepID=A0ABR0A8H4_9CRUS|nr:hypothetical protein OUZ56_003357 [Daphnia magna]
MVEEHRGTNKWVDPSDVKETCGRLRQDDPGYRNVNGPSVRILKAGTGTYLRRQLNEKIGDLGRNISVICHLVGSPSSYKGFSYWSEHQHTHKSRSRQMENESFSPQKGKPILRGKISIVKQSEVYDSGLRS